jgi:hypothetical protein
MIKAIKISDTSPPPLSQHSNQIKIITMITAITFCDTTPRVIAFFMMSKSINSVMISAAG